MENELRYISIRLRGRALIVAAVALAAVVGGIGAVMSHANAAPAVRLDRIPAHMLPSGTPVPVPPGLIHVSNDWLVSDGITLVAVYAGTDGTNPTVGRLVIVRQNARTGQQTVSVVNVPGAHALSIVNPPTGAAVETSAQTGDLHFKAANGSNGALHLRNNSTS
jgi:hypothetical protein